MFEKTSTYTVAAVRRWYMVCSTPIPQSFHMKLTIRLPSLRPSVLGSGAASTRPSHLSLPLDFPRMMASNQRQIRRPPTQRDIGTLTLFTTSSQPYAPMRRGVAHRTLLSPPPSHPREFDWAKLRQQSLSALTFGDILCLREVTPRFDRASY